MTNIGNVAAGDRVCFRVSTHDSLFEDCCSIEQCVTIPRCDFDLVTDFRPVGGAALTPFGGQLVVGNLGSSGGDGVAIDLGEAIGFDAEWLPIDLDSVPVGATLTQEIAGELDGQPDRTIVTLESVRTGEGVELRTDFSALGTSTHTVAGYRGGELVGVVENVPTAIPLTPEVNTDAHYTLGGIYPYLGIPAEFENIPCDPDLVTVGRCTFAGYSFEEPFPFSLALAQARSIDSPVDEIVTSPSRSTSTWGRPRRSGYRPGTSLRSP